MRVAAITFALALALAVAGAAATAPMSSGLRGEVTRGPTKPVCWENDPCTEPAVGVVLEFRRAGQTVARVRTGAGGRYLARLRPGLYGVRTAGAGRVPSLTPPQVRVVAGRMRRVDFFIDTGLQ